MLYSTSRLVVRMRWICRGNLYVTDVKSYSSFGFFPMAPPYLGRIPVELGFGYVMEVITLKP